jgi:glycerophosphoryl diester phosphodiesterase
MLTSLLAATLMAPPRTSEIVARSWNQTLVVGHRGAAAYAPENTLPSFEEAIKSGAVATECDVFMSQDGVPMVMHDATLDRTTDLTGRVDATPAQTMIDAGIPTLEKLITTLKGRIVHVIEIKAGVNVEQAVVDLVRKHKVTEETIVFSFNPQIIQKVEALAPEIFTVWLSAAPAQGEALEALPNRLRNELKVDAVGFQFRNVNAPLADRLRTEKIPLFVWTVPPGAEVDRLKDLRVNFIITDHPRDVRAQLGG